MKQPSNVVILPNFVIGRWRSADGNDQACRNCEVSHPAENPMSTPSPKTHVGTKAPPSITLQESSVQGRPGQSPATYYRYKPGVIQDDNRQSSGRLKRGANKAGQHIHFLKFYPLFFFLQHIFN